MGWSASPLKKMYFTHTGTMANHQNVVPEWIEIEHMRAAEKSHTLTTRSVCSLDTAALCLWLSASLRDRVPLCGAYPIVARRVLWFISQYNYRVRRKMRPRARATHQSPHTPRDPRTSGDHTARARASREDPDMRGSENNGERKPMVTPGFTL